MVHINKSDEGFFKVMIFDPSSKVWNELLAFDLDSLVLQANIIYNIDLREYLN